MVVLSRRFSPNFASAVLEIPVNNLRNGTYLIKIEMDSLKKARYLNLL